MNNNYCVYVGSSKSQGDGNHNKIGRSEFLSDRIKSLDTSYSINGFIIKLLIVCESLIESQNIEEHLHYYYWNYSTTKLDNTTSATEWFTKDFRYEDIKKALEEGNYNNEIIKDIDEIDRITEKSKREELKKKYIKKMNKKSFERKNKLKDKARDYQQIIINYIIIALEKFNKIYLELATGGGKSFIVYNILNKFKPDTIIIFSPRININEQNTSKKYLSLLNNEYLVYNCSERNDFDKFKLECEEQNKRMIIVACSQNSHKKVYDLINNYNLDDIFIWFDEAHHTIEEWVNKRDNSISNFFLESNKINKRIFTSASPNKTHVEQNKDIFGELYTPIKVKKLIDMGWLCPIIPYVFDNDDNDDINLCKYSLEHFSKFNCNFGLSFHNERQNAFKLFKMHYEKYLNNYTEIKPFLMLGDDYKNKELIEIKKNLDYNFTSKDEYEKTKNSIAYVVKKYSIGYDFKGIDYIIFSDSKTSYSDIIQCIGRGIRPDGLDEQGKNKKKKLTIMLPIFFKTEKETKYSKIVNVMYYLINDIGLEYNKIDFNYYNPNPNPNPNSKSGNDYEGGENMKAILLELIKKNKYSTWKKKDFINLLKKNNIHDREIQYKKYIEDRSELNLPEDPYICFPDFTWEQTYDKSPYYSKDECKKKISQIKDNDDELDLDDKYEPEIYLNSIDNKIPPQCLFRFYGGFNNNEYY